MFARANTLFFFLAALSVLAAATTTTTVTVTVSVRTLRYAPQACSLMIVYYNILATDCDCRRSF
jgi:hypothetical protein